MVDTSMNVIDIAIPPGFVVFCDMDGTLVDTDYANYLSYKKAIFKITHGKYTVQNSTERFNRENLRKQLPSLNDEEYETIVHLKEEYFATFLYKTKVNNRLVNLLRSYVELNKIVLVTGCREKRVMETLVHHELHDIFSKIICREILSLCESQNKYENALHLVAANPRTVFVFENDIADAEKAVLAGVPRKNITSYFNK